MTNKDIKVISAKVPTDTYKEIEEVAEALHINKNELIGRAVRLFVGAYNHGVTESYRIKAGYDDRQYRRLP